MTITNIPLNGMIDNDGSIRCFYEIQTQEALQQFYDDEIAPPTDTRVGCLLELRLLGVDWG